MSCPCHIAAASPGWKTSAGDDDHERMRGLPMIGRLGKGKGDPTGKSASLALLATELGVRGAQRGSDPVDALLAKEARQERRR